MRPPCHHDVGRPQSRAADQPRPLNSMSRHPIELEAVCLVRMAWRVCSIARLAFLRSDDDGTQYALSRAARAFANAPI